MDRRYRVGIVGGGQLARMMQQAAIGLGIETRLLAESSGSSAAQVIPLTTVGDYTDLDTLTAFARQCDVITFDHEHVPTGHLRALGDRIVVKPGPGALEYAQDKARMRERLSEMGVPCPRFAICRTVRELIDFGQEQGWPIIAKTSRGGYDGKGVMVLDSPQHAREQAAAWFDELPHRTGFSALLAEEKVPFTRELSALVARRESGQVLPWPVVETIQVNSVCDEVIAPAPSLSPAIARAASDAAVTLATELGVTGVMAAELFEAPDSSAGFYINELAMRPHNTGHWTQEGSVTSQFEQHLRAVLDMPLGATTMRDEVAIMKNYLGGENEDIFGVYPLALSAEPRAKIHFYGKETRPGRKIGHVNITGRAAETRVLRDAAANVASILRDGRPL